MQHFTYDFSPVFALVQGWLDQGLYPNGASLSVARNGRVVASKSFGNHTLDTPEPLGSAGQWLAAAAIMVAVDEGDLALDDPLSKYIPEIDEENGRATLRHLLSHTSGYPTDLPADTTLEEFFPQLAPEQPPGTRWQMGNLSLRLAMKMAEVASRRDWESFFQEKIAHPLGMENTHFHPETGPHGTVRDYGRFLSMLYNEGVYDGHRYLTESSLAEMRADHVRDAEIPADHFVAGCRNGTHKGIFGLGVWRESEHPLVISCPSSSGAYPWLDKKRHVYGTFIGFVDAEVCARENFNVFKACVELATRIDAAIDSGKPAPKRIKSGPVDVSFAQPQEPAPEPVAVAPETSEPAAVAQDTPATESTDTSSEPTP